MDGPIHLRLEIHGRSRLLGLGDEASADIVRSLFPRYVASEGSGPRGAEPHLTVQATGDRYLLEGEGWMASAVAADLPVVLEHRVTLLLLEAVPHLIHLHAAGLATGEGAVLAVGGSGTGKSSIAVAWSASGHPVLGDDAVLMGPDLTAHPFHKPLKVDVDRARAAGLAPERTLYWQAGASEVWYDPEDGGGWGRAAQPRALALLERRETGDTVLEPISPVESAQVLMGQMLRTSGRPEGWHDTLFALAERTPAHRVVFSDSLEAAAMLAAIHRTR